MKRLLPILALLPVVLVAQDSAPEQVVVTPRTIKWGPGPASLPKGAEIAVLKGNPAQAGLFTMRVKVPAGYVLPPHTHPADEHLTVLSGDWNVGLGEKALDSKAKMLTTGTFSCTTADAKHFALSRKGAVLQISAMGPWGTEFLGK